MTIFAFIFARGGSKGLPGKNIKIFNGKPLIAWSIEQAINTKSVDRVLVSTDSEAIANIAIEYGAEVPFMRPAELASDDCAEWKAWQHALTYLERNEGVLPDLMVTVPATAPLRISKDIENCIEEFNKGGADIVVTITDAHRSPWFNMVKREGSGNLELVVSTQNDIHRRQDAPLVYDMATVAYVANPRFILSATSIFSGKVRGVYIPIERAIDIDTMLDFEIAEFLSQRQK